MTVVDTPQAGFDPRDAATMQCPFPHYARLREDGGVAEIPGEYLGRPGERVFVVSRYDLVNQVLLDWRSFSSRFGTPNFAPPPHLRAQLEEIAAKGFKRPPTMLTADPPDHTRYRRLVAQAFTPKRVQDLAPAIQTIVDELVEAFTAAPGPDGSVELIQQFSAIIPTKTIATLLGIAQHRYQDFKRWADASAVTIGSNPDDETRLAAARATVEMHQYFAFELETRRADPLDDFLSDLYFATLPAEEAEESGRNLRMEEMISIIQQLVVAGSETTASLVADAAVILADHPDEWDRIAHDDARLAQVIEECVRVAGTNLGMFRVATKDTELNGVPIPAGSTMWVLFGSSNRDTDHFGDDADHFNPDREGLGSHLGFGRGVHYCLGAPLARLETTIALRTLAQKFHAPVVVDPASLTYAPSALLRGLAGLRVQFTPR